jgi:hypothetical protein
MKVLPRPQRPMSRSISSTSGGVAPLALKRRRSVWSERTMVHRLIQGPTVCGQAVNEPAIPTHEVDRARISRVSHTLRGKVAGEAQEKGCTLVPPMGMLTCGISLNPAA